MKEEDIDTITMSTKRQSLSTYTTTTLFNFKTRQLLQSLPLLSMTLLIIAITMPDTTTADRGLPKHCQRIEVPICKGLISYNATQLPNRFGHKTQTEVYWAMQPWWPFIDAGCSNNLRTFLCGLYLPRCVGDSNSDDDGREPPPPPHYPCSETCRKAKVRCSKQMRRQGMRWAPQFKCSGLLPKSSRRCISPQRERKKNKRRQYVLCDYNKLSMCRGIPFSQGSLPNMFLQNDLVEIEREMQQFKFLVDSGCSKKLRLFICGAYMPFCVPGANQADPQTSNEVKVKDADFLIARRQPDVPFVVPCRELCQEVYDQCSGEYQQRTNGLPWPGKFHCHRYPSYIDRYASNNYNNNNNSSSSNNSRNSRRRGGSTTVPCTMPPYNYDGN